MNTCKNNACPNESGKINNQGTGCYNFVSKNNKIIDADEENKKRDNPDKGIKLDTSTNIHANLIASFFLKERESAGFNPKAFFDDINSAVCQILTDAVICNDCPAEVLNGAIVRIEVRINKASYAEAEQHNCNNCGKCSGKVD